MTAALLSLALAASLVTGQYAPTSAPTTAPLEASKEAVVQKLGKKLRCAVCQGLSVSDSPSSMAHAQLDKIRELVSEGKSEQEVIDYFVARYGEWILLDPKAEGFNWFVWLAPVALIVIGGFVIRRQLHQAPATPATAQAAGRPPPPTPKSSTPAPSPDDADPYLQAVRRELER